MATGSDSGEQAAFECAQRWELTVLPPFPHLSQHYVAPALRADGTEVVLKIGAPGAALAREAAALRLFPEGSRVRLLDADLERGALLLERLRPGVPLTMLADDAHDAEATSLAAAVMRELWRPPPPEHEFPTTAELGRDIQRLREHFGGSGPFPPLLLQEAEALLAALLASAPTPLLLHGDLHHDNILSSQRRPWLAIDPHGVVGEPAYETGALVRNLWPDRHVLADPKRIMERRIAQLSEELEIDRMRIRDWAVVRALLAAWWSIEDGEADWAKAIADTEVIATIKPDSQLSYGKQQ